LDNNLSETKGGLIYYREVRDALEAERWLRMINYVLSFKNISAEFKDFGIPNFTFYRWKAAYEKEGKPGLFRQKPSI
jgi:transposase